MKLNINKIINPKDLFKSYFIFPKNTKCTFILFERKKVTVMLRKKEKPKNKGAYLRNAFVNCIASIGTEI